MLQWTSQESIDLDKVLPGLFLGYALYAWWLWKGDILVADFEEVETMDALEIYSQRLNAKEVIFPKRNGKFIFPVEDGDESHCLEEIRNWEHPLWYGNFQVEEKVTLIFFENKGLHVHHLMTHFQMPVKR